MGRMSLWCGSGLPPEDGSCGQFAVQFRVYVNVGRADAYCGHALG